MFFAIKGDQKVRGVSKLNSFFYIIFWSSFNLNIMRINDFLPHYKRIALTFKMN